MKIGATPAAAPGADAPIAATGYSTSTVPAWPNFSVTDWLALFERMVSLGIDLSATRMLFALGGQLPHLGMSISTASKGAGRWQR